MKIGEASTASGISQRMIRHYEKVGLIPAAARRDSGYRDYDRTEVHTLAFIRRARDLARGGRFRMQEALALSDHVPIVQTDARGRAVPIRRTFADVAVTVRRP